MKEERGLLIERLHQQTEQLHQLLHSLKPDMEQNDPDQVEAVNQLIAERGAIIAKLDERLPTPPAWSRHEQKLIAQIKEWEANNQARLNMLYQSFTNQYQKLQQGKRLTNHYYNYEPVYTDGAYIDKKK